MMLYNYQTAQFDSLGKGADRRHPYHWRVSGALDREAIHYAEGFAESPQAQVEDGYQGLGSPFLS